MLGPVAAPFACTLLVAVSTSTALPDSRYELDEMGEPEWNFPAGVDDGSVQHADPSWTLVNLSNVYGGDYEDPACWRHYADTESACQGACAQNSSCVSFCFTTGDEPGSEHRCAYTNQCWLRSDKVWHPHASHNCAGISGYKGTPQPGPSPPNPAPGPSPPTPPAPPPPPNALNVLFVIFDDLRPNAKAWGVDQASMPNVDKLAAKSVTFDHAYCNQAVCGPSRASLLSGRRPDTTQMWNFKGGWRETKGAEAWHSWPEWFKIHGYTSYGVGKLYHPGDPVNFDVGRSWSDGKWGGYNGQGNCGGQGDTSWEAASSRHGCALKTTYASDPENLHSLPDNVTLTTAQQFLKDAEADYARSKRKFWLGVGFVKPHMSQAFPEGYLSHVPAQSGVVLATNQTNPVDTSPMEWSDGAEESTWGEPFSTEVQQSYRRGYYAAAAYSDDKFGELLVTLDDTGFTNSTLVIMTADHGWGLGEHNHWIKYTNWETDARVPLIIHHPTRPHTWGTRQTALVEHVDLYPTVAELAGIPVSSAESIEGDSYAALFSTGPQTLGNSPAFAAAFTQYPRCNHGSMPIDILNNSRCASVSKQDFKYMGYSIRTPTWRYTEYAEWNGVRLCPIWNSTVPCVYSELYDHTGDDGFGTHVFDDFENANVAFKPEHLKTVQSLSAQLRAFYKSERCP